MESKMRKALVIFVFFIAVVFMSKSVSYASEQPSLRPGVSELELGSFCTVWLENGRAQYINGSSYQWASSNEDIIEIYEKDYNSVKARAKKVGISVISVIDENGNKLECTLTARGRSWSLPYSKIEKHVYDQSENIRINFNDPIGVTRSFTVSSSDENVVKAGYAGGDLLWIDYVGVGTAFVTVTDEYGEYGKSETIEVEVKEEPIEFSKGSSVTYTSYDYNNDDDLYVDCYGYGPVASVTSSNTSVLKVQKVSGYWDTFKIVPIGAGTADITAKDEYGQKGNMKVTLTQKYADEYKYLEALDLIELSTRDKAGNDYQNIIYGANKVYCEFPIKISNVKMHTLISGKTINAKYQGKGVYLFDQPITLSPGETISFFLQKGEASTIWTTRVSKCPGSDMSITVKAQTYSSKNLKPALTIKHGKTVLKAGADYTVNYSNNKEVGKGKAKITFIGNYRGTRNAYFNINPKPTTITKLSAAKKGFVVKWKKQTVQTTGYQIQYSTNKNFKAGNKTITVAKNKTVSKKITKLKVKKKYYVRVRTYKTVSGKKYVSAWSKIKGVTTKK